MGTRSSKPGSAATFVVTLVTGIAVSVALSLFAASASAEDLITSFEYDVLLDEFTAAPPPQSLLFVGGEAKSVGNPDLYRTGVRSWMVDAGETGTITMGGSTRTLNLFLRDETIGVNSVLTVFDNNGEVLGTFFGTDEWTEVSVVGEIGSVTLENPGLAGYAVIDDLTALTNGIEDPLAEDIGLVGALVGLETIATGLTAPNWGAVAEGLDDLLFVTDQNGTLWRLDLASGARDNFLDVTDRIVELGAFGPGSFDERGLLGIALDPDYLANGRLYTYTSEPALPDPDFTTLSPDIEPDHETVILEWTVPNPGDPASRPDPASARTLLRIYQPQFNHDGGAVNFGPDGHLYIALGDGGGADDEGDGHGDAGTGRDPSNVLGTVLRIDPQGSNAPNGQYGVPVDNPFFPDSGPVGGEEGCLDGFCDEIYAYGFRNPFRFSFDRQTGSLLLGDVGQNDIEEVNLVVSGGNYGWNWKEGTFCFDGAREEPGFVFDCLPGSAPEGLIDPVGQYDHDDGLSVIGGFVYRGSAVPSLSGHYILGEFAKNFAIDGRLLGMGRQGRIVEIPIEGQDNLEIFLLGFGEDADGELYVMGNTTGVPFEDTGAVLKIVPAAGLRDSD